MNRREFLKVFIGGVAAAAIPGNLAIALEESARINASDGKDGVTIFRFVTSAGNLSVETPYSVKSDGYIDVPGFSFTSMETMTIYRVEFYHPLLNGYVPVNMQWNGLHQNVAVISGSDIEMSSIVIKQNN